jgi:hypothetical protein
MAFTKKPIINSVGLINNDKKRHIIMIFLLQCEQQLLIELAINSDDFWWLLCSCSNEKTILYKRLHKLRRLNLKSMPAVNNVNKTNRNRYNSKISCKICYCQLKQLLLLTLYYQKQMF